jgi:putative flippase GtrA
MRTGAAASRGRVAFPEELDYITAFAWASAGGPFWSRVVKIGRFGVVSGMGWLLDFSTFLLLSWKWLPPAWANVFSALLAITFVFSASTRHVFTEAGGFVWRKFLVYLAYQACVIALFSAAIQALSLGLGIAPGLAKVLVTPMNFYANFLFMSVLLSGRLRFY